MSINVINVLAKSSDAWLAAEDVNDRAPRDGHMFFVAECTNLDGHGDWMQSFTSFRKATAYYRRIGEKAATYDGLYPDAGVRELPAAEVQRRLREDHERLQQEMEWEMEQPEGPDDDPWDDWDDDDQD